MVRFRTLMLTAALMVAGLAIASDAQAQCSDSNPLMKCPLAVCQQLQSIVKSAVACGDYLTGVQQPKSCNNISGCTALKAMMARWESCKAARTDINVTCFSGGNAGHKTAADQADLNVRNCQTRIAMPEPTGCADPCPK